MGAAEEAAAEGPRRGCKLCMLLLLCVTRLPCLTLLFRAQPILALQLDSTRKELAAAATAATLMSRAVEAADQQASGRSGASWAQEPAACVQQCEAKDRHGSMSMPLGWHGLHGAALPCLPLVVSRRAAHSWHM